MPFTFSHPAIILPFTKLSHRYISGTAIIIGSLAPDFEYFLLLQKERIIGHTWYGAIVLDLPLTLIFAFVFHNIVKKPLIASLPKPISARFTDTFQLDWKSYFMDHWFIVIYSALIGIYSHIFWDLFTHNTPYIMEHLPALLQTIYFGKISFPVYQFLQILSTIIGFIIIAIFIIFKEPEKDGIYANNNWSYWLKIALITAFLFSVRLLTGINYSDYVIVLINLISCALFSIILISVFTRINVEESVDVE